jgi:hypothetical protein
MKKTGTTPLNISLSRPENTEIENMKDSFQPPKKQHLLDPEKAR